MSAWEAITWDTARAGGFTAYLLVTISVALGLALSMRLQVRWWPRLISYELHVWVTILSFIFLGIHILASWVDPFTRFGLNEVLLPFASHYRPLWMALGIVAMYLSLAVTLSLFIRRRIGYTWWLRLHELSFAVWALATIHGLATGSDTRTIWGIELYIVSAILICGLLCARLLQPVAIGGRAHPIWAALVVGALVIAIVWTAVGPLRPGWNAIANNGNGSGGVAQALGSDRNATPAISSPSSDAPFSQPFTASVQGTITQQTDPGPVLRLDLTLSGARQGVLRIQMWEQSGGEGAGDDNEGDDRGGSGAAITATQVTLGADAATPLYQGHISTLDGGYIVAQLDATQPNQPSLQLTLNLQTQGDTVSGTVSGMPLASLP
ncbi:MAG TPA: ferric reductase-like transmembrane domain-containing protein [Ktedonobacterales bacterium]|nr:ferric reductase-like transmembrane domain-containing protein [Ktedonobacterales bacterium]